MTKQIEITWTEVLTQTAVIHLPDELDIELDLEAAALNDSVIYDRILNLTGGPVGEAFPIKDYSVTEREIDCWRAIDVATTGIDEQDSGDALDVAQVEPQPKAQHHMIIVGHNVRHWRHYAITRTLTPEEVAILDETDTEEALELVRALDQDGVLSMVQEEIDKNYEDQVLEDWNEPSVVSAYPVDAPSS